MAKRKSDVSAVLDQMTENQSKKGKVNMSKEQTEKKAPEVKAEEIEKTYKYYDLQTFELKETTGKFNFTPPATFDDALQALNALFSGNDAALKEAITPILRNAAIANNRREIIGANGASKKIVLDQIKTFRDAPEFSVIVTAERGKPGWKEQYAKQTSTILEQVKNVPFIVNAIKGKAAADTGAEDTESEE
jgi:hypothetical protein